MKAIRFDTYGAPDDVELRDVDDPTIGATDVLVRVAAAALNPQDLHLRTGVPMLLRPVFGLPRPRVHGIGGDLSGTVVRVGAEVAGLAPGDRVFGMVGDLGRGGVPDLGTCAELARVPAARLRPVPVGLTDEQAAAAPLAGVTAVAALVDTARVGPGRRVLVNGASGGVGTMAVQLGRALGAEVTGVCSDANTDFVRDLGATHVVDYTRRDPTSLAQRHDVVLDLVGGHPLAAWRRVLEPDGTYIGSFGNRSARWVGPLGAMLRQAAAAPFVSQRVVTLRDLRVEASLDRLVRLLADGDVIPQVGRTHPLADTAAALAHLATGHARAKVVVVP